MGCKWTSFKLHLRIIGYNSNRVCLECASLSVKATVFVFLFLASLKFSEVMREMFVCYSLFNLFISREDNFRKNERGCCRGKIVEIKSHFLTYSPIVWHIPVRARVSLQNQTNEWSSVTFPYIRESFIGNISKQDQINKANSTLIFLMNLV